MTTEAEQPLAIPMQFEDRRQAGRILGERLSAYVNKPDVVVLALPRGGVPVAFEVARALKAPLDVFLVRKLGVPGQEELAMGAIAEGGVLLLNRALIGSLGIDQGEIELMIERERRELARRELLYRGGRPALDVAERTVVLVDDGLATGSTMLAAVAALRERRPAAVIVAVPVAAESTCAALSAHVDDIICAMTPRLFYAVGLWYRSFEQTTDEEVRELLEAAAREHAERNHGSDANARRVEQ